MPYTVLTMAECDISAGAKFFSAITHAGCLSEAKELLDTVHYDFVILPFSEEAFLISSQNVKSSPQVYVLLIPPQHYSHLAAKCFSAGLLAAPDNKFSGLLGPMIAMRSRLSRYENENTRLQQKLDSTKILNRAKLLIMSRLGLSEAQAHHYLEKTAMDTSASLREVAMNIIRVYEE